MRSSKFTSKYQTIFRRESCTVFDKAGRGIEASEDKVRKVKATFVFPALGVTALGVLSIAFTPRLLTKKWGNTSFLPVLSHQKFWDSPLKTRDGLEQRTFHLLALLVLNLEVDQFPEFTLKLWNWYRYFFIRTQVICNNFSLRK